MSTKTAPKVTPSELRAIFGRNLTYLSKRSASVSALCRDLSINRTQFNRYLAGESFPRPDILHKICKYFNVDARVLLEPVENIVPTPPDLIMHPDISDFITSGSTQVDEALFPSGFYRFSRQSFLTKGKFVQGLIQVYRKDNFSFLRGLEAREAIKEQGLVPNRKNREFRGFLIAQEGGVAGFASRRASLTCSFNFLAKVPSFENNYWVGYTARTVSENSTSSRVTRLVYEHIGTEASEVFKTARQSGIVSLDALLPYHRALLKPDEPFR